MKTSANCNWRFLKRIVKRSSSWRTPDGPIKLSEIIFEEQPTLLRNSRHELVVVPSVCVFKGGDQQVRIATFDLTIRAIGAEEWRYVGGSELEAKQAATLFPGFPGDLRFPPKGFIE
jgi:hypothetical protein